MFCFVWKSCTYAQSAVGCEAAECHDVQSLLVLGVVHSTAHGSHGNVIEVRCPKKKKKPDGTSDAKRKIKHCVIQLKENNQRLAGVISCHLCRAETSVSVTC